MSSSTDTPRYTNGGRLRSYNAYQEPGPSGFSGDGWALLDTEGNVVSRHAWRIEALAALITLDNLDTTPEVLAHDLSGPALNLDASLALAAQTLTALEG